MRSYKKVKGNKNRKSRKRTKKQFYNMKGCSNKKCLGGGSGIGSVYPAQGATGSMNWLNSTMLGGGQKGKKFRQKGGNNGLPYGQNLPFMKNPVVPNGLTGQPWGANFKWPGVNGVSGDYNYYSLNKYVPDVVTAIKNVGANFPFLNGGKRRINGKKNKKSVKRGGGFSNSLTQDLVTGGENIVHSGNNFLAGIQGKMAPISPLPYNQPYLK
jgi:hypothetical protein